MVSKVAQPDFDIGNQQLKGFDRKDGIEDMARACVEQLIAQVKQKQEAKASYGREIAQPKLVEGHIDTFHASVNAW